MRAQRVILSPGSTPSKNLSGGSHGQVHRESARIGHAADEHDRARALIHEQEHEGMVRVEARRLGGLHSHATRLHYHGGRGGGLGAHLVHFDERLVEDVRDEEPGLEGGHAGEVCPVRIERERHAHLFQRVRERQRGRLHAKARDPDLDLDLVRSRAPALERLDRELTLERVETVDGLRKQPDHAQLVAGVGHLEDAQPIPMPCVPEARLRLHHVHARGPAVREREGVRLRAVALEPKYRTGPNSSAADGRRAPCARTARSRDTALGCERSRFRCPD